MLCLQTCQTVEIKEEIIRWVGTTFLHFVLGRILFACNNIQGKFNSMFLLFPLRLFSLYCSR